MFAPNRLLTTKEQWLLIGFTVAIITGCATLFLYEGSMGNAGAKEHVSETTVISTKAQVPQTQTENPPVTATVSRSPEEKKEGIGAAAASPAVPQLIGVAVMGAVNRPWLIYAE
ncbi:MAG: hypothetical protein KAH38_09390 [Candidatus Hydrogenedentes bacterium]|nr:hypothetical protein [Candidatus Hydrogenedentota bacterium]